MSNKIEPFEAVVTVKEAAALCGCCTETILRKAREKKFEVRRPGRKIQIVRRSLQAWYESTANRI